MKPLLVLAQPRPVPSAARTTVRIATAGTPAALGLGGVQWDAAVVRRPRMSIELLSPSLDGQISVGKADLVINLGRVTQHPAIQAYYWNGAPVVIYDATNLDFNNMPVEFNGIVRQASLDLDNNQLTLNLEVSVQALEKPVLFTDFTGAGGVNGLTDQIGKPMPAGFGVNKNVAPVWIDVARNIGMIDGYGNTVSIDALFEGASDFGARVADYANFAALAAAIDSKAIAPGRWGTCVASGLIGLGAPPVNPITVDATFGFNRPGSLITRLLTLHAGISSGLIDAAAFTALTAAVDRPIHYWTSSPRDVKDLVEAIAASCNATLLLTFQGVYSVTRAFGGTNIGTVDRALPGTPRWTKWRPLDADLPTWRMKARAARPGITLTTDQILYTDDLIDRGLYDATQTYRQGHLVTSTRGAQFIYINATPSAGHAPPTPPTITDAYWNQTRPPVSAGDLYYVDGTRIEDLRPAQIGADVTIAHTAAGVTGQGPFATVQTPVASLLAPGQNLFPWPRGTTDGRSTALIGWGNTAWPVTSTGGTAGLAMDSLADLGGGFYRIDRTSGAVTTVYPFLDVPCGADVGTKPFSFSMAGYTIGAGTSLSFYVEFRNSTNTATLGSMAAVLNSTTQRYEVTTSGAPAGTYFLRVVASATFPATSGTLQQLVFHSIKVEKGYNVTPYTDPTNVQVSANLVQWNTGASLYSLQPQEAGANVTESRVASAVTGQTPWATYTTLTPTTVQSRVSRLDGSGFLDDLSSVTGRRITALRRADNTTAIGEVDVITGLGVAASVTGQAAWATYTSGDTPTTYAGRVTNLSTGGAFASIANITNRRLNLLARADGATAIADADAITSLGVAASISGQAAWATYVSGDTPTTYAGRVTNLSTGGAFNSLANVTTRRLNLLRRADDTTAIADSDAITSLGIAASIAGQGALATRATVGTVQIDPSAVTPSRLIDGQEWGNLIVSPDLADAAAFNGTANIITGTEATTRGVARIFKHASSGAVGQGNTADYCRVSSVEGLQPYRFTVKAHYTTGFNGMAALVIYWFDQANTIFSTSSINTTDFRAIAAASANATVVLDGIRRAPAGAVKAQVLFVTYWPATLASGGIAYYSEPRANRAAGLSNLVVRDDGSSLLTDALAVTTLGTAAGIAGQAAWATYTSGDTPTTYAGRVTNLSPTGALASIGNVTNRRLNLLQRADGITAIADADAITSLGTASAIAGQAAWATNTAGDSPTVYAQRVVNLSTGGALASISNITARRLNLLQRADGVTAIADADAITSLGVAASITGQGALATKATVTYGTGDVTGFGALAARAKVSLGDGFVFQSNGTTSLTDALAVTSLGTASAIAGQATWATNTTGDSPTVYAQRVANLSTTGALANLTNITLRPMTSLFRADGTTALTEAAAITSLGTAAAITGQGALATKATVTYGTGDVTGFGALAARAKVNLGDGFVFRADGTTSLTDALAVTSLGTAASITGQATWATNTTGDSPTTYAQRVANLSTGGNLASLTNITARPMTSLFRADGTTALTEAAAITSLGVAASVNGQGAFATYTGTVGSLTSPRPNLFPYPRGTQDGRVAYDLGWRNVNFATGTSLSQLATGLPHSAFSGAYYSMGRGSGSAETVLPYFDVPLNYADGYPFAVSFNGYSAGTFSPYVEWVNVAGTATLGSFALTINSTTNRWEGVGTAPTGTGYIRLVCRAVLPASSSYQDIVFYAIKIEGNSVVTPYTDAQGERVTGERLIYSTGATANSLRPQEAGANVTEGRTAAAFTNQGRFATRNTVGYGDPDLTGFQRLASYERVRFSADGSGGIADETNSYWVSNAVAVTNQGTAAAFSGQGAFATLNTLSDNSRFSGGLANRLTPYAGDYNYLAAGRIAWSAGSTVEDYKPAEAGANVTGTHTASAISGQGDLATANRASLAFGQNAVINSDYAKGTLGWTPGWNGNHPGSPTISRGVNLAPGTYSGQMNVAYATLAGATSAGYVFDGYQSRGGTEANTLADMKRWALPVVAGDLVFASLLLAVHRCTACVTIAWFDGAGGYITENASGYAGRAYGANNGDPANFDRMTTFATAPTNARYALMYPRALTQASVSDPYIFFTQMMLAKVPAGQTAIPPYSPGPGDRFGDKTTENLILDYGQGQLPNGRNLPAGVAMNIGYTYTGSVTYSAAAGNPPTATITVSAGSILLAGETINYNAMTVNVTGQFNGSAVSYFLYVDDQFMAGGSRTLIATTVATDLSTGRNRIFMGAVSVNYPTTGTGTGTGGAGGGAYGTRSADIPLQ